MKGAPANPISGVQVAVPDGVVPSSAVMVAIADVIMDVSPSVWVTRRATSDAVRTGSAITGPTPLAI